MNRIRFTGRLLAASCVAFLAMSSVTRAAVPPRATATPLTPRASNAIDLTGVWVSVVTEDWRWRMVTPPKGDYASMPLNPEGRRVADSWDPAQDGSCMAYGAAGLLRMPTRLRIGWESDSVLKIETDAGQQSRRLVFDPPAQDPAPSLQGFSRATWLADLPYVPAMFTSGEAARAAAPPAPDARRSSLQVITTHLTGGWLRRNGVPYSADAVMTEYFDRFAAPNGDEWLVVTTVVDDPRYLYQRYITSSHFKQEPDDSRWRPKACS